jgi:AbrB family looped-hinge helix DNA binding protein
MEKNMKTLFEVRVRRNGQITLPIELRKRAGIEPGTPLTFHDLGNGALLLSKARSRTAKLADTLAQQWQEAGVSLEDMLAALRQVRTEKH